MMANTTKKTAAPKKTVGQKIDKKIEAVANIDDIIIEQATKDVATFTVDRWHVLFAALAVTAAVFTFVL
jgi:ribosomal protein S25